MSQSHDPILLIGKSAAKASSATKGRKTTAQGKALGSRHPTNPSPEAADDLPPGWTWQTVGELAAKEPRSIVDGPFGSKLKTAHYTDSGPRVIRLQNIGDGQFLDAKAHISEQHYQTLRNHKVDAGDIVIAAMGEDPPRACIVPATLGPAIVKADCIRFKPDPIHSTKFLEYSFNSPGTRRRAKAIVHGVGRPRLNQSEIKAILLPVAPPDEQRRIVARIEELFSRLDAGVAALRHAKAQLQRYRQSVLAAAVTGQLTQAWREQHPDTEPGEDLLKRILERRREEWNGRGKYTKPVDHDPSDLKELPENWTWSSFESVLTELRNGISKKPDATDGLRILRISAVRPLVVDLDDSRFLSDSLSKFATYELEPNDLLFTRYNGTRAFVGVCGLVPKLPEPFVYPDKLIRARLVDQNALLPSFVEIAMNAGESRRFLEKRIRTTAGQSGISGGDIKVTPLPIPPLAEQHQIVAEVEARTTAIDHLEAELDRQITRSNRLRQSVLAAAFRGC